MKTTIEIPDDLLLAAKRRALERRTTLRAVVESGLRRELAQTSLPPAATAPTIRWITVPGGLPAGLDIANREALHDWIAERADLEPPGPSEE